jgi:hypothetical protein
MSENNTNGKNVREDEIDLLDLFRRMGRTLLRWGNTLVNAFLHSVVFIAKRWLPLGLSIILGIGIAYFIKTRSSSFYTSDMVLRTNSYVYLAKKELPKSNSITTSDLISFINRNTSTLIDAISASQKKKQNIIDIEAYWVVDLGNDGIPDYVDYSDKHDVYDTINVAMKDRFDIRLRIDTPQDLASIRNGIIQFINSDSLFQQRNKSRLKQTEDMIGRLNYDIKQIDSMQQVKYVDEPKKLAKNGGQIIFLQDQKTQLFYQDIQTLYTKRQALETDMDLYKDIVTVLDDFTIPETRVNGVTYYLKIIVPLCFVITLAILIVIANRKKLREVYNKY